MTKLDSTVAYDYLNALEAYAQKRSVESVGELSWGYVTISPYSHRSKSNDIQT